MPINSTSNNSFEFGGISGGAPAEPYLYVGNMELQCTTPTVTQPYIQSSTFRPLLRISLSTRVQGYYARDDAYIQWGAERGVVWLTEPNVDLWTTT